MADTSRNPVYRRLAELARRMTVSTTVQALPRAELDAALAAMGVTDPAGVDGVYSAATDSILVDAATVGTQWGVHVLTHETAHAITDHAFNAVSDGTANEATKQLVQRIERLYREALQKLPAGVANGYWRTSAREFAAEAMSNEDLQRELMRTEADTSFRLPGVRGTPTLWTQFVAALRSFFGVTAPQVNLLEEVLYATEAVARESRSLQQRGLGRYVGVPRTAPAPTGTPIRRPGEQSSPSDAVWRAAVEQAQRPTEPHPDDAFTQEQVDTIEDEGENTANFQFYGAATGVHNGVPDTIVATGRVLPLASGMWKAILGFPAHFGRPAVEQTFETSKQALDWLKNEHNVNAAKVVGEVNPQPDTVAYVDQFRASSPLVRRLTQAVRAVLQPFAPQFADWAANRTMTMLNTLYAGIVTDRYFAQKFDQIVGELEGVDPALARRIATSQREISVVHNRSELARARDSIIRAINAAGMELGRLSLFRAALHAPERNASLGETTVVGPEGPVRAKDVVNFTYEGLTGQEALDAFDASLTPEERVVFGRLNDAWTEARRQTNWRLYQSGMLTRDEFYARSGPDARWPNYLPIKRFDSEIVNQRRRGVSGGTSSLQQVDYAKLFQVAFAEMEGDSKAAITAQLNREIADAVRAYPTAFDALVGAREPRGQGLDVEAKWVDADLFEENSLVFFEEGRRRKVVFNDKETQLYINARRNRPNLAISTMGAMTHMMAATRTTWAVPFIVQAAAAWDTTMTLLGFQNAAGGTLNGRDSLRVASRSLSHFIPNFRKLMRHAWSGEINDPYLMLYSQRGGGVAPGARSGFDETSAAARQLDLFSTSGVFDTGARGALQRAGAAFRRVETVLHTTEDLARFSAFKAYLEHRAGRDAGGGFRSFDSPEALMAWAEQNPGAVDMALEVSRKITGDFSDRGAWAWPRAAFMFFNPAVQGVRQLSGVAQTRTGQAGLVFAAVASLGLALGAMDDPEDEDEDGGSRFLRRRDLGRSLLLGDDTAFPVPPEVRFAVTLGEVIAGMSRSKMTLEQAAVRMSKAMVDTVAPLNVPEPDAPIESYAFNFTPAALQPLIVAAMGVDSFGNDTEVDAGMVRDAQGNRVVSPANFERGRTRDPEWAKYMTQKLYDLTGIDWYPGRVAEVANLMGGTTLRSARQAAEEGPLPAVLARFHSEYNPYAIRSEFEAQQAEFERALRQMERQGAGLEAASPEVRRSVAIMRRANDLIRDIKVAGRSRAQLYQLLQQARGEGNQKAAEDAQGLIDQYNAVAATIRARALRAVNEGVE